MWQQVTKEIEGGQSLVVLQPRQESKCCCIVLGLMVQAKQHGGQALMESLACFIVAEPSGIHGVLHCCSDDVQHVLKL